ncbi:rod shape-determining protein RodA [bacterium]|nr:rod shape-determining protein RodA [bacterium]
MLSLLRQSLKELDYYFVIPLFLLIGVGLLFIYSATKEASSNTYSISLLIRQSVWAIISLAFFFLITITDYRQLPRFSNLIYFLMSFLLILVLLLGKKTSGAQRWFQLGPITFQPSELAKVMLLITISSFWAKNHSKAGDLETIFRSFIHISIPTLLVFFQPDLGTSLTFVVIWLASLLIVGVKVKHLIAIGVAGIILVIMAWHFDIIRPYQKKRIEVFLNPNADPYGAGYHIIQSRIAIGSGEVWGKGLFKGTQNRLNYIPAQHTDFIFTVVGEELGFVGCLFVILLYFLMIWRCFLTSLETEDLLGQMICALVGVLLTFHSFVNIGMTLGIMPAVGIPLPFLSYGGSNLLSFCIMAGLVQSIHQRRKKLSF